MLIFVQGSINVQKEEEKELSPTIMHISQKSLQQLLDKTRTVFRRKIRNQNIVHSTGTQNK